MPILTSYSSVLTSKGYVRAESLTKDHQVYDINNSLHAIRNIKSVTTPARIAIISYEDAVPKFAYSVGVLPDTAVLTDDGYKPMGKLIDSTTKIALHSGYLPNGLTFELLAAMGIYSLAHRVNPYHYQISDYESYLFKHSNMKEYGSILRHELEDSGYVTYDQCSEDYSLNDIAISRLSTESIGTILYHVLNYSYPLLDSDTLSINFKGCYGNDKKTLLSYLFSKLVIPYTVDYSYINISKVEVSKFIDAFKASDTVETLQPAVDYIAAQYKTVSGRTDIEYTTFESDTAPNFIVGGLIVANPALS